MIQERLDLGPIHPWLPGPMKVRLGLLGDEIRETEVVYGFATKGILSRIQGRSVGQAAPVVSHLEPESAFLIDGLFCRAVEAISGVQAPERAQWIRRICSDLSEIGSALRFLARMARRLEMGPLFHSVLKHRESLMDMVELLSGSRFGYFYLVPGGARFDLTEGFRERLETWAHAFRSDLPRLEALFAWTHPFQNRLNSVGCVLDSGALGFVSDSAVEGVRYGRLSHVESRIFYVLDSCRELSENLLKEGSHAPGGPWFENPGQQAVSGAGQSTCTSIRGDWGLKLQLDGASGIREFAIETPSDSIRAAVAPALETESLDDLPLILESLFLSISEIDR